MSRTGAAFSVRFLRNGDQVIVVRNIINRNGAGAALFQVVDPNSGVVKPDWDATGKSGDEQTAVLNAQPIIQLGVRSSAGFPAQITGVTWAFDGTTLNFTLDGSNWVTASNDSRFQARINGQYYEMKIVGNIASSSVMANKQISYQVSYISNAMTDNVRGDVDVLIQAAGSNSHIMQITANRVELDDTHTSATLTAIGYYGVDPVTIGSNGYTIKWYQDGAEISGQTSNTLTVTRDMVSGGSIFVAKLFKDGNAVAQDGQRINDIADEYQINYTPTNAGSNYCGIGHNASFDLSLLKNGSAYTPAAGSISYAWQIYNALGIEKTSGTGSTVTVTPNDCLCGEGQGAYHSDCDVRVTAEFT